MGFYKTPESWEGYQNQAILPRALKSANVDVVSVLGGIVIRHSFTELRCVNAKGATFFAASTKESSDSTGRSMKIFTEVLPGVRS